MIIRIDSNWSHSWETELEKDSYLHVQAITCIRFKPFRLHILAQKDKMESLAYFGEGGMLPERFSVFGTVQIQAPEHLGPIRPNHAYNALYVHQGSSVLDISVTEVFINILQNFEAFFVKLQLAFP